METAAAKVQAGAWLLNQKFVAGWREHVNLHRYGGLNFPVLGGFSTGVLEGIFESYEVGLAMLNTEYPVRFGYAAQRGELNEVRAEWDKLLQRPVVASMAERVQRGVKLLTKAGYWPSLDARVSYSMHENDFVRVQGTVCWTVGIFESVFGSLPTGLRKLGLTPKKGWEAGFVCSQNEIEEARTEWQRAIAAQEIKFTAPLGAWRRIAAESPLARVTLGLE